MSAALPTAAVFRNSRRCKTGAVVIARYLEILYKFSSRRHAKRLRSGIGFRGSRGRRAMDGFADALIGAAAANVAAHGFVDVGIGGIGFFCEQRDGGHDLAGLAVAALGDVFGDPGFLHGVRAVEGEALDGRNIFAGNARDHGNARARGFTVDVHGAGAAERHAAAEFRAGHVEGVAQDPEERHVWADVDVLWFAVQGEGDGHGESPPGEWLSYNNFRMSRKRGGVWPVAAGERRWRMLSLTPVRLLQSMAGFQIY